MIDNKKLVYDFNNHRLYYDSNQFLTEDINKYISLTVSAIELDFDYSTGVLFSVTGFQPLVKSIVDKLEIPNYKDRNFNIPMNEIAYQKGIVYDYFNFFPASKEYFMIDEYNPKLVYDENNKRIQIGTADIDDEYIRINKNTICGLDKKGNLKSILLLIDVIIKAD